MKSEIKEKIEALKQTMTEAVYIVDRIISFLKAHDYTVDQSSLVDSVKKMDYHTRKALENYMLNDDPDKVLELLGRSGGGIKVKEEGRDSPKGVIFPQMKAAEEPQVTEALTFAAEKYFSTFYTQFLKLFDDEEKAAAKAVDKVVRILKIKPTDRDDLLIRIKDKFGIAINPAKLVGVAEKIEQLKKS